MVPGEFKTLNPAKPILIGDELVLHTLLNEYFSSVGIKQLLKGSIVTSSVTARATSPVLRWFYVDQVLPREEGLECNWAGSTI